MLLWADVMILYDKILWADDTLFIMSRWYMTLYYDYGWWCIVYPGKRVRLCIRTLAWRVWFKNSFRLWLCQSKSLLLSGMKDQNSLILGTKPYMDLGFLESSGPWAMNSAHLVMCPGLWVWASGLLVLSGGTIIWRMKLPWADGLVLGV